MVTPFIEMDDVFSLGVLDAQAATAVAAPNPRDDSPIVQRSAQTDTDLRSRPR